MRRNHKRGVVCSAMIVVSLIVARLPAAESPSFLRDVAPILLQRCAGCHGPKKSEGGYRLHTFTFLMRTGDSGEASVVAKDAKQSELFRRLIEKDESVRMPQLDDPLTEEQISLIRRWIDNGAVFDGRNSDAAIQSQLPPRRHPPAPDVYRVPVPVTALEFAPDESAIVAAGYHEVTFWSTEDGRLLQRIGGLPQRIQSIRWTSDERFLVVAGGSPGDYGEVSLVDAPTGQRTHVFATFPDIVLDCDVSPDGRFVAAVSADRMARVFSLEKREPVWRTRVHSDWATGVAFSPDGRFVVSSSRDQTLKVYRADSGELFTTYNGHRRQLGKHVGRFAVFDVVFDAKGQAYSVGEGSAVRVWSPVTAQKENGTAADMEGRFFKAGHTRYIETAFSEPTFQLSVGGSSIAAAGADGVVKVFDRESRTLKRTLPAHADWVYAVALSENGDKLASGSFDGEVRLYSADSDRPTVSLIAAPGHIRAAGED